MSTKEATSLLSGIVRDAMTTDVHAAEANTPIAEVANRMADANIRRIVIVNHRKQVQGVVSQRDVIKSFLASDDSHQPIATESNASAAIETVITRDKPITVSSETSLIKAALVLATNKIGCLPVVGVRQDLKGILSATDLIRHITGRNEVRLESSFELYQPTAEPKAKMPAYVRKANGDLVIPLSYVKQYKAVLDFAVLGYDSPSGRILLKFVSSPKKAADAIRTKRDEENLSIPAAGFVAHFNLLGKASAFEVSVHENCRYIVLTPRQSGN